MKSNNVKFLLCLLFFVVLAAITFRCCWGTDMVFSASDLNIGRLAAKKNMLPELLTGQFTANQVLGGSAYGFTLFHVLLAAMPLTIFANTIYGLILVFGSLSMVWFLRIWERSWGASVVGALIAFWFNSITLASGGHAYKMEVLAFSVLSLCLIEKAIRATSVKKAIGFSVLAGPAVGIMMIEQQDVALLAGLFVGSYTVFRLIQSHRKSIFHWLGILFPVGIVAILISGSTMLKSYQSNIAGAASVQKGGDEKWNYITQWSMVPSEWPDLIAPGWGGWSSGNPEGPYWGKIGRSAEWETQKQGFSNFKLDSLYLGIIPFLLALYGVWSAFGNRKEQDGGTILFWGIAAFIGLLLAFGKYSPLYKLFYQLPMVSNIRAPVKFLDNVEICLAILAAYGLDRLLVAGKSSKSSRVLWIGSVTVGALMLLAGIKALVLPASITAGLSQMGLDRFSDVIIQNVSNAWFHAAVLALVCGALAFLIWKGKQLKWVVPVFVVVLVVDSLMLSSHYFKATDIATVKKGNDIIQFLKANQKNERTFFMDQAGIYNQWLASDGPFHGLNLFNIWQMPRMPSEYKEFLGTVGRNQIRMWELSSVKYVAAPAAILQQFNQNPELGKLFKPVLNYQVPTANGMRKDILLEFKGAVPRFALYHSWQAVPQEQQCRLLVSNKHNPQTTVLVDPAAELPVSQGDGVFDVVAAEVSKKNAIVEVSTEGPAILRFAQRMQPGWTVYVDGKRAGLLQVDYLCMGVLVPAGTHTVEFRCVDGSPKVAFTVIMVFLVLAGGLVLVADRKGKSVE
ncbi:hypothetical protein P4E94_12930 [Pontiellaceae bacterium B12219]|nr:hypothetical protein [Pontiellaceae bacterium B12219]